MNAPPPPPLADADARARIASDLDATLFVEAAAGTGKTTALVSRIIEVIRSGRSTLDRVVAVTFTDKAAGEMRLRLRAEIERHRSAPDLDPESRERFEQALEHLELARIGTIHAFCADVLRERPVEAGVDPQYEVVVEEETVRLLDEAFDDWFEKALDDPPEGVRRVLRRTPERRDQSGPRDQLRTAAARLVEHRDFTAPWRRPPFDRETAIDALLLRLDGIGRHAAQARDKKHWLVRNLTNIARFLDENRVRENTRGRDYDALEAELRVLLRRGGQAKTGWDWRGFGEPWGGEPRRSDVIAERDEVRGELERFVEAADADLAACLREELRDVVDRYARIKQAAGRLDFFDLLIRVRDLLVADDGVRHELQERFTHFFIDEFQDTDPRQAEIMLLLAADDPGARDYRTIRPVPGKLFIVGDPKQSIYRFRRADIALYESIKERLLGAGAEVLNLSTSFRAVPSIQDAVNGAFAAGMSFDREAGQAAYVALQPSRDEAPAFPTVVALPAPRIYTSYGKIAKYAIDDSFPDAVAAFVAWLLQSGWTVEENGESVPVAARHVCLLFRRFRSWNLDITRPYVQGLEARHVPHVLVGGRSFHDRDEVLALRNALTAIEWPDDALAVYATLRGPFFAVHDHVLFGYRHAVGSLHPLWRLDETTRAALAPEHAEVADALDILRRLHAGRNRRPIAHTVARLLDATRAHAGIAVWPTGEQALANCLRVVDRAQRFERRGAPSFRAFVEWLDEEAERGQGDEAPVVEEGTDGVRVMTVHKAKGLEFPVVILADPTCNATSKVPSQHVDTECDLWAESIAGAAPWDLLDHRELEGRRENAEAVRLAYVAATRARDLLVVPAVGDHLGTETDGWWLDALAPAIYPAPDDRRSPAAITVPGAAEFGPDSVLERPDDAQRSAGSAVQPGLHVARAGNRIVWWDPSQLELGVEPALGRREETLLRADEAPGAVAESTARHDAWQEDGRAVRERAAVPTLRVRPVTAVAHAGDAEGRPDSIARAIADGHDPARPGGARFGTLVHAALAVADLDADEPACAAIVRAQARLVGAPDDEIEAATSVVTSALAHPLLDRARASADVRRETPVLLRLEDDSIAEGVIDLAFEEAGAWVIVDYKTDRDLGDREAAYAAQVALYVDAVAQATGMAAEGWLLVV